jgi:acyl-CoA thioesterase I
MPPALRLTSASKPCRDRSPAGYGAWCVAVNLGLFALLLLLAPSARAAQVAILAFGDSLTAGFGLAEAQGFPAQLQAALVARGIAARVVDGGVSGDTSAGGLARLDWSLADKPDLVILELGANDALRGLDPAATRANLDAILARLKAAGVAVLIAGMRAPPNLGRDYAAAFDKLYPELAAKYGVPLYPFFLDGVAIDPRLTQPDGLHPNAAGVGVIVERLLPTLLPAIAALKRGAAG